MNRAFVATLGVGFLLMPAGLSTASAANNDPRQPGSRVRVTATTLGIHDYVGTIVASHRDTLVVDSLYLPMSAITQLDHYKGQTHQAGRGALIGAVGGFAIGAILGYKLFVLGEDQLDVGVNTREAWALAGGTALLFCAGGAALGGLIGWGYQGRRLGASNAGSNSLGARTF